MRDKPSIRGNDAGGYTVTRPRVGLGEPELKHCDTHADAVEWLRTVHKERGSTSATADRAYQLRDGIATVPQWERPPYGNPARGETDR